MRVYGFSALGFAGRLGNQLWQVAATISRAAHDIGSRPFVNPDWEYRPYLSLPEEFYEPPQRGDEVIDLARDPSGPYFQRLSDIDAFDPDLFAPWRFAEEPLAVTAMHVRRGDYLKKPERFPQLTQHYYESALKQTQRPVHVYSDDIDWCKANPDQLGLKDRDHEFIDSTRSATLPAEVSDLVTMSRAHSIVIANSTFSWWAAYLSNAEVFYPDRWFGPDVEEFTGFPRHWTCVPC